MPRPSGPHPKTPDDGDFSGDSNLSKASRTRESGSFEARMMAGSPSGPLGSRRSDLVSSYMES